MKNSNLFSLFTVAASLVLLGVGCSVPPVDNPAPEQSNVNDLPTSAPTAPVTTQPASQPTATVPPKTTPPAPTPPPDNPPPVPAPAPKPASKVSATIAGFSFQPNSITVSVGDTVTWTNNDGVPHTVTADNGSFGSGTMASGGTFRHTFTAPGTFSYNCAFHGSMRGTVIVK